MESNVTMENEVFAAVIQALGETIVHKNYGNARLSDLCVSLEEQNKQLRKKLAELTACDSKCESAE